MDDHDLAKIAGGASLLQDLDHARGLHADVRVHSGVADGSLKLCGGTDHYRVTDGGDPVRGRTHRSPLDFRSGLGRCGRAHGTGLDRKSTRLNSSHANNSYAVFCLKKNKINIKTLLDFKTYF